MGLAVFAFWLPASASAATGKIEGTVTEQAGGAAVSEARACAEGLNKFELVCSDTKPDGTYEITALPADEYIVFFFSSLSGLNLAIQYYDRVVGRQGADLVSVGEGATVSGALPRYAESIRNRAGLVSSGLTTPNIDVALLPSGTFESSSSSR